MLTAKFSNIYGLSEQYSGRLMRKSRVHGALLARAIPCHDDAVTVALSTQQLLAVLCMYLGIRVFGAPHEQHVC
jgi:hypothetical protein